MHKIVSNDDQISQMMIILIDTYYLSASIFAIMVQRFANRRLVFADTYREHGYVVAGRPLPCTPSYF